MKATWRKNCKGMTLIEMLLSLLIGSIFFSVLFLVGGTGIKQYAFMRQKQDVFYELTKVQQFIRDELHTAETVGACIRLPREIGYQEVMLYDMPHDVGGVHLEEGEKGELISLILDEKRVEKYKDGSTASLRRVLRRVAVKPVTPTTPSTQVYELRYQENVLSDWISKWELTRVGTQY